MLKSLCVVIFLSYSAVQAVKSDGVASQPWLPAVPPVVRSGADAAEAFAYCAARAEHYASGGEGDRSRYIDAARDFAYCASVAHCVKATAAPCVTTTCPDTPAPMCHCQHDSPSLPLPYTKTTTQLPTTTPVPTTTNASTICGENNGYKYSAVTSHCYKLYTTEIKWVDAKSKCLEEGAILAVPNSVEEAQLLANIASEALPDWEYIHVGMFRSQGLWKTVTGESVSDSGFNVWAPGQSQWTGEEWSYGRLRSDAKLDPGVFEIARSYVCEKTPDPNL